jgi:hypothetical protein
MKHGAEGGLDGCNEEWSVSEKNKLSVYKVGNRNNGTRKVGREKRNL